MLAYPAGTGDGDVFAVPRIVDPHGRRLDYLRVAVTDRCNLRCRYCMPAAGVPLTTHDAVLRYEELETLLRVFARLGVRKVRITGGEPLVRKGLVDWLPRLRDLPGEPEILLTTNGTLLRESLPGLAAADVRRVNLSLDTLRPDTWRTITRRDGFAAARAAVDDVLRAGLGLKINVVVQPGVNDGELDDFVALARDRDLTVRFIEPMPFSGEGGEPVAPLTGGEIVRRLAARHELREIGRGEGAVARLFEIPGHRGRIGVIEGHTRSFCGDCSRLRLDARGRLRTCLYAGAGTDLGAMLRAGASESDLARAVLADVAHRDPDGWAAQKRRGAAQSMSQVGG